MTPFTTHEGSLVPLDRANVDTDQIIPKQFLKSIRRTGFGDNLFDGWRYLDEGEMGKTPNERQINTEFVLNQPRFQGASVLLARENFGCGSSREHAVWALKEYGFVSVLAPSFADIFFNNCFKNGFLPIVLEDSLIVELFDRIASGEEVRVAIDLAAQTVVQGERSFGFEISEQRKHSLLNGLDEIGVTLSQRELISAFESEYKTRRPWTFMRDANA